MLEVIKLLLETKLTRTDRLMDNYGWVRMHKFEYGAAITNLVDFGQTYWLELYLNLRYKFSDYFSHLAQRNVGIIRRFFKNCLRAIDIFIITRKKRSPLSFA